MWSSRGAGLGPSTEVLIHFNVSRKANRVKNCCYGAVQLDKDQTTWKGRNRVQDYMGGAPVDAEENDI